MKTMTKSLAGLLAALFLSLCVSAQSGVSSVSDVRINEVDCENPGTDTMEFVELYGPAALPLDGLVLVFFNGLSDNSYGAFDLDGYSLDENGFFVLGSAAVPNVDFVINDNFIQPGPDAVVLYEANGADFPNNTPVSFSNLVDALVYGTDDPNDAGLLALLNAGEPQVNESANGNAAAEAMARIPDGGAALTTSTYVAQSPTPGATNMLSCMGGSIETTEATTSQEVCQDLPEAWVEFVTTGETIDATYYWVICNQNNGIIEIVDAAEYNFTGSGEGVCHIWGASILGTFVASSIEPGDPVNGILASGCVSISDNFIEISKVNCVPPVCDGGQIAGTDGGTSFVLCTTGLETTLQFSHVTETPDATYLYVITNESDVIIETFTGEYDFGGFDPENCRVWGLSYTGTLLATSINSGDPLGGISSSDCVSISENFVFIQKVVCEEGVGCTDLFFSEYIEGASQNKALEIYNPTPFTINLSGYSVHTYNDGAVVPVNSINLSGSLASGATLTIVNAQAMPSMVNVADITSNVTFFNGNDAIALRKNGIAIDIIGIIGQDPGKANPWTVANGEGSLAEYTLVRSPSVTNGVTVWEQSQAGWIVYPANTITYLGNHTTIPCNYPENPSVGFTTANINVLEGNTVNVNLGITFPITEVQVEVAVTGGTATAGSDFNEVGVQTLTFPEASFNNQGFSFSTIDDSEMEGAETIVLEISAITPATILIGTLTVTILPSDQGIPLYDILEVRGVDATTGVADSLGVYCELRGIVHGLNTNPAGLEFTLIDETGGISVFHADDNFGYTLAEGDSIHLTGNIAQFNGLTQIEPDFLFLVDGGHPLNEPVLVASLNENTESAMVQLKCFELADPSQWTNQSPGFVAQVTNGSVSFDLWIDEDTDIFGVDAPIGVFTASGIGSQFDATEPFTSGYLLRPRYLDDLTEPVNAFFTAPGTIVEGQATTITNASAGAGNYSWNMGDGTILTDVDANHTYANEGTYTVTLTAFGADGVCSDQYSMVITVGPNSVMELPSAIQAIYPNPATDQLTVVLNTPLDELLVCDATGRMVMRTRVNGLRNVELDIAALAQGTYFIATPNGAVRFVKH